MSNAIALDRHLYYNQWTPADGADDKRLAKLFIADVIENNKSGSTTGALASIQRFLRFALNVLLMAGTAKVVRQSRRYSRTLSQSCNPITRGHCDRNAATGACSRVGRRTSVELDENSRNGFFR